ncbi:alanyl (membrane) aminopeptidase-like b [Lampris incognitus]|uniref:alanyl (membrane) aminopeptidase-like b n=1 Tax=Lampris incognitus TaxID=2546036 RepID=UPI0024B528C3|nr:alanyl (membrane) aminopeptidase-like b [Lampris incognitus]
MVKELYVSKVFAVISVILTVSAIAGVITMVAVYQIQIGETPPTPRPTFPPTTPFPTRPPLNMRLPGNLVPESYKLYLQPHLYTRITEVVNVTSPNQTFIFTGNSTVDFHCVQKTKTIFLHSKDLTLHGVKVTNRDTKEEITVSGMKHHEDESDFLEIQLGEVLEEQGNYSLFVAFEGDLMNDLAGLYVSRYNEGDPIDGDNTERYLVISQMQPTDARKMFPCFDEPAMKAVFDVTIIHRRDTTALANWGKADSSSLDDEWTVTQFYPTKRMSTYLLAIAVSEFKKPKESPQHRVEINTYARPEAIEAGHADYAAIITRKILKFYEDYFAIDYPQTKLDQIAVPDLGPAAMENWGLVTYRETALLYDDKISSSFNKEWIALVISHEIAHQWFGNLVTMKWWNEVWLNEGFATYMSYLAVEHTEPDWNIKDIFVVNDLHTAFEWDSLASSHPLNAHQDEVQTPVQIIEQFDDITYCKGATVLRMVKDVVTERVFHRGIKMYLNAFKYGNTDHEDLWVHLQKAVDENYGNTKVAALMDTWTNHKGYPVITINTNNGAISQKRFLFNQTSDSSPVWIIPIRVMSEKSDVSLIMLNHISDRKNEFISNDGQWILANVNCYGYFRVNYNQENWERLLTQLETDRDLIPVINRGQLVDDAFNLARAKLVDVRLALNSTRFLYNETEYIPWESAMTNLNYFVLMFDRSEVYGPMRTYLRRQVKGLYNFFRNYTDNSTVPSDHSQQHNQINAIAVACTNGLPECQIMATTMFKNWMEKPSQNNINPNLRSVIYCNALAAGGEDEWEFAWKMFQNSTIAAERDLLRQALSCTKKIWLLNRYLEYTLDPDKIRKMDTVSTINYIARNVAGQALAWNFIRGHWTYINEEYGGGMMPLGMLIEGVTYRFSTDFELQELKEFQMEHDDEVHRALEQAIERTEANIEWVRENKQTVLEWFKRELSL